MARAGRKRKSGVRTKADRLSRAGQPKFIKGNERAQAMQAIYGTNGTDSIGRAFVAGLLGAGAEAQALLDTARAIHKAYWSAYCEHPYRCTLSDIGGAISLDHRRVKAREKWLAQTLHAVQSCGHNVRRAFDQLVIDVNPDSGPSWLDQAIYQARREQPVGSREQAMLDLALRGLREVAY